MPMVRACESMLGFEIGVESDSYGPSYIKLAPAELGSCLETRKFSYETRYLFPIRLVMFYPVDVKEGARMSVEGVKDRDSLYGNVVVFGEDEDGPKGLTDFEVSAVKYNLRMLCDDKGNFMRLVNVSSEPRALDAEEETDE